MLYFVLVLMECWQFLMQKRVKLYPQLSCQRLRCVICVMIKSVAFCIQEHMNKVLLASDLEMRQQVKRQNLSLC